MDNALTIKIDKSLLSPAELTDVAALVNQEGFAEDVFAVRKKYDIPPPSSKEIEKFSLDFSLKEINDKGFKESFFKDIEKIRRKFERPTHFRDVIRAAILYGETGIYHKAYLKRKVISSTDYNWEDVEYSIVIHPGTGNEDILRVFREFKKEVYVNLKGTEEEKKQHNFGYWFDFGIINSPDTRGEKAIEWFKKWKSGMSPLQISLEDLKILPKEYKKMSDKLFNEDLEIEEENSLEETINKVERYQEKVRRAVFRYQRHLRCS
jgi:hypothetical protein